jgi:hypothetical protein
MPSPFPGMNPYLENSALGSDFHHRLITAIADLLTPQLEPKYIVAIERRIYEVIGENPLLVGIPDVMVQPPLNAENSTTNVAILSPPRPTDNKAPEKRRCNATSLPLVVKSGF